jgi:hypothetical protein
MLLAKERECPASGLVRWMHSGEIRQKGSERGGPTLRGALVGPGGPASSAGGSELRHLGELVFNYFSGEGQRHWRQAGFARVACTGQMLGGVLLKFLDLLPEDQDALRSYLDTAVNVDD